MFDNNTIKAGTLIGARASVFLYLLVGAMFFGYQGKAAEMGLTIVAGALGLAFLNLDRFRSIKAAGFEAQLRDAVSEAYATTEHVKSIGAVLAEIGLTPVCQRRVRHL